ncbi:succinylglutamate desuccinylase/aspartoacylase family protein [Legionella nagasakiensis]|uniref:succinylglutamate desuccinylase/aspartoacylase family protein n=1 Tax=Legionella nagasakiensis TaxID=535290 RepID=UPI001056C9D9|nr:succinylglutamate desuccinylase/aspartoacylase family protein [Legionella nagasakiensis]
MKNSNLPICNVTIHPGETANLALPLPEFYSCVSFYMPIKVVHGKQAGPCLLIFSTVKGDELNGLEIINRLLQSDELKQLHGTLIAIPVLNVLGLTSHSNNLNYETNLEHCFPGQEDGTYGQRIAYFFTREILSKANYCIELQTGSLNHDILPQIYCNLADPESKKLAQCFAAPVITNVVTENNTLRQTTENLSMPLLVYQAGEAMRFGESEIELGLAGIKNVMKALEMLPNDTTVDDSGFKPIFSQDQEWIYSHRSGVLNTEVELGQKIRKNQVIGLISDPFSADTVEPVKAPHNGIVVGVNRHPLIHEGQTIFKIATFIDNTRAETALEAWNESQQIENV